MTRWLLRRPVRLLVLVGISVLVIEVALGVWVIFRADESQTGTRALVASAVSQAFTGVVITIATVVIAQLNQRLSVSTADYGEVARDTLKHLREVEDRRDLRERESRQRDALGRLGDGLLNFMDVVDTPTSRNPSDYLPIPKAELRRILVVERAIIADSSIVAAVEQLFAATDEVISHPVPHSAPEVQRQRELIGKLGANVEQVVNAVIEARGALGGK